MFFWAVTYTFAVKWDTWDLRILDAGFHEIEHDSVLGTDAPAIIKDKTGQNSGPWLLNGSGVRLAAGGTPVYKRYSVFKLRNFGAVFPI